MACVFLETPETRLYLHAVTSVEALARCEKLLGFDRYQLNIEACDDIPVLWTLSDRNSNGSAATCGAAGPATEFGQRGTGAPAAVVIFQARGEQADAVDAATGHLRAPSGAGG